jgi:hypothetical protein
MVLRRQRRLRPAIDTRRGLTTSPDDMAIVYALETAGRIYGILVDACGVYSDPAVSAFLANVSILEKSR